MKKSGSRITKISVCSSRKICEEFRGDFDDDFRGVGVINVRCEFYVFLRHFSDS